jgi:hypothetical protein
MTTGGMAGRVDVDISCGCMDLVSPCGEKRREEKGEIE